MIRKTALALSLAAALCAGNARPAEAQVLSGLFGAGVGTAAGGYITLSIVVARAQAGHYLHDFTDLFDWKSLPIVIGATAGTGVGIAQPERMFTGFIYGGTGTVVGGTLGFLGGAVLSKRPEAKWAWSAIGAGTGMAIGSMLGTFVPNKGLVEDVIPGWLRNNSSVPVGVTIRF
jgi:hypothetical protein